MVFLVDIDAFLKKLGSALRAVIFDHFGEGDRLQVTGCKIFGQCAYKDYCSILR
jgi:hypothetical protein